MATLRHYSAPSPAIDLFESIPREHRAEPIVKWSGSKKRFLGAYDALLPSHFETYHEPFVGGGAVFLFLAHVGRVRRALLSDLNAELIHLYRVVRDDVERLIVCLSQLRYDRDQYYAVREAQPEELDAVGRAARTLYLNRTCFNGYYRVNSQGRFNVPFGRYENPTICNAPNLRNVSRLLQGVELQHWSYEVVAELARPGDFVFLDPPTQVLSAAPHVAPTEEAFDEQHQGRLSEIFRLLDRRGCLVMLSNAHTGLVRELYRGFDLREVHPRSAEGRDGRSRPRSRELVIRNYA